MIQEAGVNPWPAAAEEMRSPRLPLPSGRRFRLVSLSDLLGKLLRPLGEFGNSPALHQNDHQHHEHRKNERSGNGKQSK